VTRATVVGADAIHGEAEAGAWLDRAAGRGGGEAAGAAF
jgi:hypothetical protein